MGNNSVIDLGGLSKPATALINKIAAGTGILFEPHRIQREAKAKADAALIEARSQIEVNDLNRRAVERWVCEQAREQQNIESITAKALSQLEESADASQIDDDWIAEFFARSRRVSNEQMQDLWARILAGEANSPNSVSKRTLEFLSLMDKADAELFSKLCQLSLVSWDSPLVFNHKDAIVSDLGLNFVKLAHLEAIGLIQFSDAEFIRESENEIYDIHVSGKSLRLYAKKNNKRKFFICSGCIMFTLIGFELRRFLSVQPAEGFYDYCVGSWHQRGYSLASPYPQQKLKDNDQ